MKKVIYVSPIHHTLLNCFLVLLFVTGFYFSSMFCSPKYNLIISSPDSVFSLDDISFLPSNYEIASSVLPIYSDVTGYKEPAPFKSEPHKSISITSSKSDNYTPSQGIFIQNDTDYSFDIDTLLNEKLNFNLEKSGVLIYHTHTCESYTPSEKFNYEFNTSYRCTNPSYNVTRIGEEIASVLKKNKVNVLHDKSVHDYPSYSGSYDRSLDTINKNLSAKSSINIVLDIHRDAIADSEGKYLKTIADKQSEQCAQAMIVVGTDFGGLPHPSWKENLKLALMLQRIMLQKYPSLARPIHLRQERFNGHASNGALLIEIGSNGNTMDEALVCANRIAECLCTLIKS